MAFSQSLRKGQIPTSCKLCEVETKISWKCMDCDILMCNRCKERIHPNLRNARNHKVMDIKEVGPQTEEVDFSHIPCKVHKGQVCFMFCKSCDQLVCPQCIAKIHNSHMLVEIREGYQIHIQRLKDGQNEMKIKTDKLAKDKLKIKEIKKAENAKYIEAKKKNQANQISLKKAVDEYSENLLKELDQKWETLLSSIEKEESNVITLEKNKTDRNILIEDIIQSKDAETIFEMSNPQETSLEEEEESVELNFTTMPTFIPGEISQYNVGSLQHTSTDITLQHTSTDITLQHTSTDITLQVIKEYTTDISTVLFMSPCVDSLWIGNNDVVQKVQLEVNNLKVISSFDVKVSDMDITTSNDLLLVPYRKSVLKQISVSTNKLTDTNYSVDPLVLTALHITNDGNVIVGARNSAEPFTATGRGAVIMMDKEGKHKTIYEYDRKNQPIFTNPKSITTTNNGNICVVDKLSIDSRGRVVVLDQEEDIINIYNGHPDINTKDTPFKPVSIVTTPTDNIIVTDLYTEVLHILNIVGHMITHIKTRNIGIHDSYTMSFTTAGKMYIGCTTTQGSTDNAKLYEVKLVGC